MEVFLPALCAGGRSLSILNMGLQVSFDGTEINGLLVLSNWDCFSHNLSRRGALYAPPSDVLRFFSSTLLPCQPSGNTPGSHSAEGALVIADTIPSPFP